VTSDDTVAAVQGYLSDHFAPEQITVDQQPAGVVFRLAARDSEFALTVVRDFLDQYDAAQIGELLRHWNLADELRRADGLPMVVSEEGVRLASSN